MKDEKLEKLLMELAREFAKKVKPNILFTELELSGHLESNECDFIKSKISASAMILVSSSNSCFYCTIFQKKTTFYYRRCLSY